MAVREITPDQLPKVREITQEQIQPVQQDAAPELTTFEQIEAARSQTPSIGQSIVQRFLGTDVDDPQALKRTGTTVGGGILGASFGARTPTLPGPAGVVVNPITGSLIGGLVGTVAGSMAPEATLEFGEAIGMFPEGTRESLGLENQQLARVAKGEALLEAATFGVGSAARFGSRQIGRALTKPDVAMAESAARQGVDLSPFQVSQRGGGSMIVNVLGRMPFVGNPARRAAEKTGAQIDQILLNAPSRIAPILSTSQIGNRIYRDARNLVDSVGKKFNQRYTKLFNDADAAGVRVSPANGIEESQRVLSQILEETPTTAQGQKLAPTKAKGLVSRFIDENITPLSGPDGLSSLSLKQTDDLIERIDETIGLADDAIRSDVARLMMPVKDALKRDALENVSGEGAEEIVQRMASIDSDFAETMQTIFNTSVGKRFSSVRKGGLRGSTAPSQEATRIPVDKLYSTVVDLESPQAISELGRLVSPKTMRQVAARTISDAINAATVTARDGSSRINASKLAQQFGLDGPSSRGEAFQELLKNTGFDIKDLQSIVDAVKAFESTPVPNVNTFVARSAALRSTRGIPTAIAGAATGGLLGGSSGFLGTLLSFGGLRGLTSIVSEPATARAFKTVLSEEASLTAKNTAALRLGRFIVSQGVEVGSIAKENAKEALDQYRDAVDEVTLKTRELQGSTGTQPQGTTQFSGGL